MVDLFVGKLKKSIKRFADLFSSCKETFAVYLKAFSLSCYSQFTSTIFYRFLTTHQPKRLQFYTKMFTIFQNPVNFEPSL